MNDAADRIEARLAGTIGAFSLDVAFEAPMRGVTALFGPSGSGKTTVLRAIAGIQRLAGRLAVGGEIWQDDASGVLLAPHRRAVGYVFQEPSLFSHLTVRGNLAYGARRARASGYPEAMRLDEVVGLLGIAHLMDRGTAALSGGERQRVAIARALLARPRLLLMDEPLASLDRGAKDEILPHLEALHDRLAIPIVYVSHDLAEVERLADTLVLMDGGRIVAAGPLTALQTDRSLPLARLPVAAVTLEATVTGFDDAFAITTAEVDGVALSLAGRVGAPGETRRIRVSAADVSLTRSVARDTTILNIVAARIVAIDPHDAAGAQVNVLLDLGTGGEGARILARITAKSCAQLGLAAGEDVFAQIKSVALVGPGHAGGR